jgi:hypothetical protein
VSRAPICYVHRKQLTFVRAENYTYWQCPKGCWLDIDPPMWGDSKLRWPKPNQAEEKKS